MAAHGNKFHQGGGRVGSANERGTTARNVYAPPSVVVSVVASVVAVMLKEAVIAKQETKSNGKVTRSTHVPVVVSVVVSTTVVSTVVVSVRVVVSVAVVVSTTCEVSVVVSVAGRANNGSGRMAVIN
jgi:hypothetical protein